MTSGDIAFYRLQAQQITHSAFDNAGQLVSHMGAMQAQDFGMVKWALGLRLPGSGEARILEDLDSGEVLRTHVLRPTWHLVAATDLSWMLALTAPHLRSREQSRFRELELSPKVLDKCLKLIAGELENGHKTREELMAVLNKAGIATNDYRSGHIMYHAELEALVCSGSAKGNKQTYALLAERVPQQPAPDRETSLKKLASLYFNSHGPASLQDFAWWSGLSLKDARSGLEAIQSTLQETVLGHQSYWFTDQAIPASKPKTSVYLLPAFDEFLISYKDRSASLPAAHTARTVSKNGIFFPIIVINGQVAGLWKRTLKKDKVLFRTEGLPSLSKTEMRLLHQAMETYAAFLGLQAVLPD